MTTALSTLLILVLSSLSTLLDAAPAPVCPLAGSSSASLERLGNDPTAYQLTFKWNRVDIPIDFVDYHYRINDGEFMNFRAYDGSTPATEAIHAVTLHPGDVLHAMVTYSSNRVGCEVAISEHRTSATIASAPTASAAASAAAASAAAASASASAVSAGVAASAVAAPAAAASSAAASASTATPANQTSSNPSTSTPHTIASTSISCTHINQQLIHDGMGFNIHTELPQDATKVDAHVNISGANPINIRMIPSSTFGIYELPSPFIANIDSTINYYLTFASDSPTHSACDTQTWSTVAEDSDSAPAIPSTPAAAAAAYSETAARTPAAAATVPTSSSEQACSLPAITHGVMRIGTTGNQYIIHATSAEEIPYAYVDVHAMVGDSETNARIGINTVSAHSEPITVPSGQALNYYLTYASDEDHACNSPMFSTGPM